MFAFLPAETRVAQRVHLIHLTPERPFPSLFVMTLSFTRPVEETATGYAHNLQPKACGSPDLLHNKMRNSWGTVTCDKNSGGVRDKARPRREGTGMCRLLVALSDEESQNRLCELISRHPASSSLQIERCNAACAGKRALEAPRVDVLFIDVAGPAGGDASLAGPAAAGNGATAPSPAAAADTAPSPAPTPTGGIDVVRELQACGSSPLVVYTTTRKGYTSQVYATQHEYLLLKPFSAAEVGDALAKVLAKLGSHVTTPLALRANGSIHVIDPADIEFVKSVGRRVEVHLTDSSSIIAYASLQDIESKLPGSFLRTHKSYLANMACVEEETESELTMLSGKTVAVSQRQHRCVRDALMAFNRR